MPTITSTILDQISAEKSKVSERLARLDSERTTVTARLRDLETAERVLTRVRHRLPPLKQRPQLPAEAGDRPQEQPLTSRRDANPVHRALQAAEKVGWWCFEPNSSPFAPS